MKENCAEQCASAHSQQKLATPPALDVVGNQKKKIKK